MSRVDWSKSPEGAEFSSLERFWFVDIAGTPWFWDYHDNCWGRGSFDIDFLKRHSSYKERPKQENQSTVMIGNEFGLALVESLGLDPTKVSTDAKLNVGSDEVFSVDFRVNLTIDEVRKACDIICAKDNAETASKKLVDELRGKL